MDFNLSAHNTYEFIDQPTEITHYKKIVDEYNVLKFNLELVLKQIDVTAELNSEIDKVLQSLNVTFEKYKIESAIVRSYLYELEILHTKVTFTNSLYRFEQMLVVSPLIKVEVDEIQNVLTHARIYSDNTVAPYYYFSNNPYDVDDILRVTVPTKKIFDVSSTFITDVYNYMYGLYTMYLNKNKVELHSMVSTEKMIENKIYEYTDVFDKVKSQSIAITPEQTNFEYFDIVEKIKNNLLSYENNIVSSGVYRFTNLVNTFESISNRVKLFISDIASHQMYVDYKTESEYNKMLDRFSAYITLIEDGKINVDCDYIITDMTLKEIVSDIIEMTKVVKKPIVYTQKYSESGKSVTLSFEFYQTELFLLSVKEYYYNLMTSNIFRYSKLDIDNYGDSTIDDLRNDYKFGVVRYNNLLTQETYHLNNFEFDTFVQKVVKVQELLKTAALTFFTASYKLSPPTYAESIERDYTLFLKKLTADLEDLKSKRLDDILLGIDENKISCRNKLIDFKSHVSKVEIILVIAKKNVFFGFNEYIDTKIYTPIKAFSYVLTDLYNKGSYIQFLNEYNAFYNENIIDFNILYALEKFSDSVDSIFTKIGNIDKLYLDEITHDKVSTGFSESVDILTDLFDDETYKVVRSELFAELDILYEFIISTRPNEKAFLLNEKNLKKLYFDNQLMRINYIRWFHNILRVTDDYEKLDHSILILHPFYLKNKDNVVKFSQKGRISALILTQSQVLSEITKMIVEYSVDTKYNVKLSTETISNIEYYNESIKCDFYNFVELIGKFKNCVEVVKLENKKNMLIEKHRKQWTDIIINNNIIVPDKVDYTDSISYTGNVPFTVELKAKMETTVDAIGNEIQAVYKWFVETLVLDGNEVAHTFYDAGTYDVRCEITYSTGEAFVRHITFNLDGPKNSQIVKMGDVHYAPLELNPDVPKMTYADPESGILVTRPLYLSGALKDMLDKGAVTFSTVDTTLLADRLGYVFVGYNGVGFPGHEFDNTTIFDPKFAYPDPASEFLFDFRLSVPISGNTTVDITGSKFITFMTKVPSSVKSVYDINNAAQYTTPFTKINVTIGDKLVLRNNKNRYCIIEIKNIVASVVTGAESGNGLGKYTYNVDIRYFVNTSLGQYDRDEFRPEITNLAVPTLVFKANVREMFNMLITRLERINLLYGVLDGLDVESYELVMSEIKTLEAENKNFYLFYELDNIKSKRYALTSLNKNLLKSFDINFELPLMDITPTLNAYKNHLNGTKTFSEYMNDVHAYDFKQNIVDISVLIELYKDQQTVFEILTATYAYNQLDVKHFKDRLKEIKLFDVTGYVDEKLKYGQMLIKLVVNLRNLLFKIKLIVNYQILSDDTRVVMTDTYYRLKQNLSTNEWHNEIDMDLFLLNKKLELHYGYEIKKVESDKPYTTFISDIVSLEKETFGRCLSEDDIVCISSYIQYVESKTIAEYDDFFLIQFWLDYLEKNV